MQHLIAFGRDNGILASDNLANIACPITKGSRERVNFPAAGSVRFLRMLGAPHRMINDCLSHRTMPLFIAKANCLTNTRRAHLGREREASTRHPQAGAGCRRYGGTAA